MQQHAFDNVGADIVGFQILYRAQGAETGLHRNALVYDLAAVLVVALLD
jgi:hypothetical protein